MKKNVKETLKLAVERLFIRVHSNLFLSIDQNSLENIDPLLIPFDKDNESHRKLVSLCKSEIGYDPLATERDIFFSILKVYSETKKEEKRNGKPAVFENKKLRLIR